MPRCKFSNLFQVLEISIQKKKKIVAWAFFFFFLHFQPKFPSKKFFVEWTFFFSFSSNIQALEVQQFGLVNTRVE